MFVVALTRFSPAGPLEGEVGALAPVLGVGAYELRLSLAATPPVVLWTGNELDAAKSVLALLRGRGHGAVACDAASVASSDAMASPRSFSFTPDGLDDFRYADMLALLVATHVRHEETNEQHTEKELSLSRAALSGGLVLSKKSTVSKQSSSEEREPVLYVMHRSGSGHLLLRAGSLRYTGLGERIGRTVHENFQILVTLLRERAPKALFDDRLQKPRRGSLLAVSGTSRERNIVSSNEAETDLAAHLLTVAALQGQV